MEKTGAVEWSEGSEHRSGRVLVVDDERIVREVIVDYLAREGYATEEAADGVAARQSIERLPPDLVILDLMLPGMHGLDLCRWIRAGSALPVIVLSARAEETDRIVGLEVGADDYLVKPFSPRELVCRVRAVLRRTRVEAPQLATLRFADCVIDSASRELTRAGVPVMLTAREFDLLWFLASHPRRVFSRAQLMSRVWGYAAAHDTGSVTVYIRRLREKVEADPGQPRLVQTMWGVGYRFWPDE